jgi:hypothetical protein
VVTTVRRVAARVEDISLAGFDLVAALHPHQATEPAIRAALASGLDFAVVPCCVFAADSSRYTREEWLDYLASLAPGIHRDELPITGSRTVLWRRADTRTDTTRHDLDDHTRRQSEFDRADSTANAGTGR